MKSLFCRPALAVALGLLALHSSVAASLNSRTELAYPNLPGLITLRCDFNLDSVTTERSLWPTLSVQTAWQDGLDAVAVIDSVCANNSGAMPAYEEARPVAGDLKVHLIPALALTDSNAPGAVALFTTNGPGLCDHPQGPLSNAVAQGGVVFLKHGEPQRSRSKGVRPDPYLPLVAGVEIVNGEGYDRAAHQWAFDHNLTLIGNSPAFDPRNPVSGEGRSMTLVFAKEPSLAGIKDALLNRRSAVVCDGRIYGAAEYLGPLFQSSVQVISKNIRIRGKGTAAIQIQNSFPIDLELRLNSRLPELDVPSRLILPAGKVVILEGTCISARVTGEIELALPCRVLNLLVEPGRPLRTALRLKINYIQGT